LIVEFARDRQAAGQTLFAAAVEAAQVRLRPIIMTSFAFILGVVPLVIAGGAGAEMRRTLGTAVFAGMLGVTLFGIVLTPVFFYVVRGFTVRRSPTPAPAHANGTPLCQLAEEAADNHHEPVIAVKEDASAPVGPTAQR
jgi:multidrug efflux pump